MIPLVLLGCAVDQVPLGANDPVNLVLIELHGAVPAPPAGALAVQLLAASEDPARAHAALLSSQWKVTPGTNHLPRVLGLYGYHTATTTSADAASFGFAEVAGPTWAEAAIEPFLVVDRADDAETALAGWLDRIEARGLRDRTAIVLAWTDGWEQPGALWWVGPKAPSSLGDRRVASTVDVAPTMLAAARATVPSDAGGVDLAAGASQVAFGEGADGTLRAWSSRHRLTARAAEPLPEACPADAVLTDASGHPTDDGEARTALWGALRDWRLRLAATSGPDRLGREHFQRLNAARGYWQ